MLTAAQARTLCPPSLVFTFHLHTQKTKQNTHARAHRLQLPRGLPSGDVVRFMPPDDAAAAAAAGGPLAAAAAAAAAALEPSKAKFAMSQLEALGRLTGLRQLLLQMDSPSETAPAFVDGRCGGGRGFMDASPS